MPGRSLNPEVCRVGTLVLGARLHDRTSCGESRGRFLWVAMLGHIEDMHNPTKRGATTRSSCRGCLRGLAQTFRLRSAPREFLPPRPGSHAQCSPDRGLLLEAPRQLLVTSLRGAAKGQAKARGEQQII